MNSPADQSRKAGRPGMAAKATRNVNYMRYVGSGKKIVAMDLLLLIVY